MESDIQLILERPYHSNESQNVFFNSSFICVYLYFGQRFFRSHVHEVSSSF